MAEIVQGTKLVPVASDMLIIQDSEDGFGLKEITLNNLTIDSITLTVTEGLNLTYTLWSDAAQTQALGTFVVTNGIDGGIQPSEPPTPNNLARWDGGTGDLLKNSKVNVSDVGHMGIGTVSNNEAALAVKGTLDRVLSGLSSITAGTPVVSGTNTFYQSELNVGDEVVLDSITYQIISIGSNTILSVHQDAVVDATSILMYSESNLVELHRHDGGAVITVDQDGHLVSSGDVTCINTYTLGKLGIGTTDPDQAMHIKGSVQGSVRFKIENNDTTDNAQAGYELIQGSYSWTQYVLQSQGDELNFWSATLSNKVLTLSSNGTVKVPNGALEVGELSIGYAGDEIKSIATTNGNVILRPKGTGYTGIVGDTLITGFTTLGDAAIKVKKITGTFGSTEGDTTSVAHGVTLGKILEIKAISHAALKTVLPHDVDAGFEYKVTVQTTNVVMTLHATNSENLLSQPFTVLVTYEA